MAKQKREVEVVVLSDIHLGTYGCHAKNWWRISKVFLRKC